MSVPECYGFIPARYDSTRFPGKPLAEIMGKPMFWHVWHRASQCRRLSGVALCTDDERIAKAAASLDVPCLMTRPDHANGTSRIHEAAVRMGLPEEAVAVNIQGDEPALVPAMLDELLFPFSDGAIRCATLACPIDRDEAMLPDRVKVVRDRRGDALYFSRSMIPHDRDEPQDGANWLLHIGLYAFRVGTLADYVSLPPSPLEEREKLEQLRLLEHGIPIRVCLTPHRSHGVDTPQDLERIKRVMERDGR